MNQFVQFMTTQSKDTAENPVVVPRLVRDGKVAVIYSPNYGAGWSTWAQNKEVAFDADMAQAILDGNIAEAIVIAERKYPDAYRGGLKQAKVKWLPVGTRFRINEYDGSEDIVMADDDVMIA